MESGSDLVPASTMQLTSQRAQGARGIAAALRRLVAPARPRISKFQHQGASLIMT